MSKNTWSMRLMSFLMVISILMGIPGTEALAGALKLPASVKSIEEEAFYGDNSITGVVTIGGQVRSVGANAFTGTSAYAFDIGASVESIGPQRLTKAAYVYAHGSETSFSSNSFQGVKAVFGNSDSTAEALAQSISADFVDVDHLQLYNGFYYQDTGNAMRLLCAKDSRNTGWQTKIPETVTGKIVNSVSNYAFMGCTSLQRIELPITLRSLISSGAIADCSSAELVYYSPVQPINISNISATQDGSGNVTITVDTGNALIPSEYTLFIYERIDKSFRQIAQAENKSVTFASSAGTHTYFARFAIPQSDGSYIYGDESENITINVQLIWSSQPDAPQARQITKDQVMLSWIWLYPADSVMLFEMANGTNTTFIGEYSGVTEVAISATPGLHRYALKMVSSGTDNNDRCVSTLSKAVSLTVLSEEQFAPVAPVVRFEDAAMAFTVSDSAAPIYDNTTDIALIWDYVSYAEAYRYTLERQNDTGFEIILDETTTANSLILTKNLFVHQPGTALYRFGIYSIGGTEGTSALSYFKIKTPDESILVNGSATAQWDRTLASSGSRTFTIQSECDWWIESKPDWISVDADDGQLTLTMAENRNRLYSSTGEVVLSNGINTAKIAVNHGRSTEAPALTYNNVELSTNENDPTMIPYGTFTFGISKKDNRILIKFYKQNDNNYTWFNSANSTITINSSSFNANVIYRISVSGHYSGNNDNYSALEAANDSSSRDYYIRFETSGYYLTVNGQSAYRYEGFEDDSVSIYSHNNQWTATSDATWLSFSKGSTSNGSTTAYIEFSESNYTGSDRTGHINLIDSSGSLTAVITVIQRDATPRITSQSLSSSESAPTILTYNNLNIVFVGQYAFWGEKSGSEYTETRRASSSAICVQDAMFDTVDVTFNTGTVYRIRIADDNGHEACYFVKASQTAPCSLSVTDSPDYVPASTSSYTASLYGKGSWTATSNQSWLTISPASGTSSSIINETRITYNVAENTTGADRTATVTFKMGAETQKVVIKQSGERYLEVYYDGYPLDKTQAYHHFSGNALSTSYVEFLARCGGTYTVTADAAWISTPSKAKNSGAKAGISLKANDTGNIRSGNITFTCGTLSKTVTIHQMPKLTSVISSPVMSTNSSTPTTLPVTTQGLFIQWNRVDGAVQYCIVLKDNNGETNILTKETGSTSYQYKFEADSFDPSYQDKYYLWLYAYDQYGNRYKGEQYYLVNSSSDLALIDGRVTRSWDEISDSGASSTYTITSAGGWTSTASSWLTVTPSSGESGTMITVTAAKNSSNARTGTVQITSGTATATLAVSQYAALDIEPALISPSLSRDNVQPTAITLLNSSFTCSWKQEPQAKYYDIWITPVDSGVHLASSGHLKGTNNSYTFTNLMLEEGKIYKLNLKRTLIQNRADVYGASVYYFTVLPSSPYLSVTKYNGSELLFDAIGEEDNQKYLVNSSGTWTAVSSDPSWLMVGWQSYDQNYLERYEHIPEDHGEYVTSTEDDFYISVLTNTTGMPRTGTVTVTTPGAEPVVIYVEQEESYELPAVTAPTLGKSPSTAVILPYESISLAWTAGTGNTGIYALTLYEKTAKGYIDCVFSCSDLQNRNATIPLSCLKENTAYRLKLETTLSGSGDTVYKNFYFTTDVANALGLSIDVNWSSSQVAVSASAYGGAGGYSYAYSLLLNGEKIAETSWCGETRYSFPLATGTYSVIVYVKDSSGMQTSMISDSRTLESQIISLLSNTATTVETNDSLQTLSYSVTTTGDNWRVTDYPEWIIPTALFGENGEELRLTIEENTSVRRTGIIELYSNFRTSTLTVIQAGKAGVTLATSMQTIDSSPQTVNLPFISSDAWVATNNSTWLTLIPSSGLSGQNSIILNVLENKEHQDRIATITIISEGKSTQFHLTQSASSQEIGFGFVTDTTTPMIGQSVTFTITHGIETQQLRLIVDDDEYDTFDATGAATTFTRAFNVGGTRNICFQRMINGEWAEKTALMSINIRKYDDLSNPAISIVSAGYAGYPVSVNIESVPHADNYIIRINDPDGNQSVIKKFSENELVAAGNTITIEGKYLYKEGTWPISVMATGYGYTQSETISSFTLTSLSLDVNIIKPEKGQEYVSGSPMEVIVNQTGGGYMNIRLTDEAGTMLYEYPDNPYHLTHESDISFLYTPEKSGTVTVSAVVYPVDASIGDNAVISEDSVSVNVIGPGFASERFVCPGSFSEIYTWIESIDGNDLYIRTNEAVDAITIDLNGENLTPEPIIFTGTYDPTSPWERLFKVTIPNYTVGRQHITATAYDYDMLDKDEMPVKVTKTQDYYYAEKLSGENQYLVYPIKSGLKLVTSPIDGSNVETIVVGGAYVQPLIVTYNAGDWVRVKTVDGANNGFIKAAEVSKTLPSSTNGKIAIISPISGTITSETNSYQLTLKWAAGLQLSVNPSVKWILKNESGATVWTHTYQGYGEQTANLTVSDDGSYSMYAQTTDINGITHISNVVTIVVDELTESDEYWQWYQNNVLSVWSKYNTKAQLFSDDPRTSPYYENNRLYNVIRDGYIAEEGYLFPCCNWKEGFDHVTQGEEAVSNLRLAMIGSAVRDHKVGAAYDSDDAVEGIIKAKEDTDIINQKVTVIFDSIRALLNTASTGLDIAQIAHNNVGGETIDKIQDLIGSISDITVEIAERELTAVLKEFDAQIIMAAYVDAYKQIMLEISNELINHLEKTYFNTVGQADSIMSTKAFTYTQDSAYQFIKAYRNYQKNVQTMPSGSDYVKDGIEINHEALNQAVQELLTAGGMDHVSLKTLETSSENLQFIIKQVLPRVLSEICDALLEKMVSDFVDKVLKNETAQNSYPWMKTLYYNIAASELKSLILDVIKKLIYIDITSPFIICFDFEEAAKQFKESFKGYLSTVSFELFLDAFIIKRVTTPENMKDFVNSSKNISMVKDVKDLGEKDIKAYGWIKTIHSAIKNAWKTGSSYGKLFGDISYLSALENGLSAYRSNATLYYLAEKARREVVTRHQSGMLKMDDPEYLRESTTDSILETYRAALITILLYQQEAFRYMEQLKEIHYANLGWVLRSYDGVLRYGIHEYYDLTEIYGYTFFENTTIDEYLTDLRNLPVELKSYVDSMI